MTTLEDAKQYVREKLKDGGVTCPCCQQHAQVYRRSITSSMAAGLLHVYRAVGVGMPFDPLVIQRKAGLPYNYFSDFQKLRYWGLIRNNGEGCWEITGAGWRFLMRDEPVAKHASVYNGELMRLVPGKTVTIRDCLRKKFDLVELLSESRATSKEAKAAITTTNTSPHP